MKEKDGEEKVEKGKDNKTERKICLLKKAVIEKKKVKLRKKDENQNLRKITCLKEKSAEQKGKKKEGK